MGSWYQMSMTDKTEHLTPTEHRLLACLVRNPGWVESHEELLEAMLPSNPSRNIRRPQNTITQIRNKIEIEQALPRVIITHCGRGYSFSGREEARWFPETEVS
jgi:DNA-binding response OmpR family regulator